MVNVKVQDIDDPSLTVKIFKTSMTLVIKSPIFSLAQRERKIILGENGPIKLLVGAQDGFLRIQCEGVVGKR